MERSIEYGKLDGRRFLMRIYPVDSVDVMSMDSNREVRDLKYLMSLIRNELNDSIVYHKFSFDVVFIITLKPSQYWSAPTVRRYNTSHSLWNWGN